MRKKQWLCFFLNQYRLLFAYISWVCSEERMKIDMDIEVWEKVKYSNEKRKKIFAFSEYMLSCKEFRNLFQYRIRKNKILRYINKTFFPPMDTLYIVCNEIGGGMFIQHGFATIVVAESIGENFWVNQQVTIGYKGTKSPKIGNNVKIFCGAIIVGDVYIGDNATVGCGSVVTKNVNRDCVVAGNPAKVIKMKV